MKNKLITNLALASCAILSIPAVSADFVVSAQRIQQLESETTAQVIKLTKEDITALAATDIYDVLSSVAAIQVSGTKGTSIGAKGFYDERAGSNVLILLNGHRLNTLDLSTPNLNNIDISQVQSIEILTGNTGVIYGNEAVAAVISIDTLSDELKPSSIQISANSYGGSSININKSTDLSGKVFDISFGAQDIKGYRENSDGHLIFTRIDSELDNPWGKNKLFISLDDTKYGLTGSLTKAEFEEDPTQTNTPDDSYNSRKIAFGSIQDTNLENGKVWINEFHLSSTSSNFDQWGDMSTIEGKSIELNSRLKGSNANTPLDWLLGFDFQAGSYANTKEISPDIRENTQFRTGIFTQAQHPTPIGKLSAGARFESVSDDLKDSTAFPDGTVVENSTSAFEASLYKALSKKSSVTFEAGQTFRFANVDEQTYTLPNVTSLKPQKGFQTSLTYRLEDQNRSSSFNLYSLKTQNEIYFDNAQFANVNSNDISRTGASLSHKADLTESMSFSSSIEWISATYESGTFTGSQLPWTPEYIITSNIDRQLNKSVSINMGYRFESEKYEGGDDANANPAYEDMHRFDSAIAWANNSWVAKLSIDNLLDYQYPSTIYWGGYYPADGRKVTLSLTKTGF